MSRSNPFSLIRASEYTKDQINALWVELGGQVIEQVIRPTERETRYILGGKGTGKTHLLRYHSYPVARLRHKRESGLSVLSHLGFFGVFLRATAVDAARFEPDDNNRARWQTIFGVYLELSLVERLLNALLEIIDSSQDTDFDQRGFLEVMRESVPSGALNDLVDVASFRDWVIDTRRSIDTSTNEYALTGELEVCAPFSLGGLALKINHALTELSPELATIPVIYLIDEIENFSHDQQVVLNTLLRLSEGSATFRITGRLYSIKTTRTLVGDERNIGEAEFAVSYLDSIIQKHSRFPDFAKRFIAKRLSATVVPKSYSPQKNSDPLVLFPGLPNDNFYEDTAEFGGFIDTDEKVLGRFREALNNGKRTSSWSTSLQQEVCKLLIAPEVRILQRLNILMFCKKFKKNVDPIELAQQLSRDSLEFQESKKKPKYFFTAYNHYSSDLFAQSWRQSGRKTPLQYSGFSNFVRLSSGNPRTLLILLGRAHSIAAFRGESITDGKPVSISVQNMAAVEAASFVLETDVNFGRSGRVAKDAAVRLATLLRTARYSLNIPEAGTLAVSFSEDQLTDRSLEVLEATLRFSLLFDRSSGRPDRNSERLKRKVSLNPVLAPRWLLPAGVRGDISLNSDLANSIFDSQSPHDFDDLLNELADRWGQPFGVQVNSKQPILI